MRLKRDNMNSSSVNPRIIHQLAIGLLGSALAGALFISGTAHAATDDTLEELGALIEDRIDQYIEASASELSHGSYVTVDDVIAEAEAIHSAASVVQTHLDGRMQMVRLDLRDARSYADRLLDDAVELVGEDLGTFARPTTLDANGDDELAKKLRDLAAKLNAIAGALTGSVKKIMGVWIVDPTILAPGYTGGLPPESYGAIVSGYGNGQASSIVWETYDVAGYGDSYSESHGFGVSSWGDDYYDSEAAAEGYDEAVTTGGSLDDTPTSTDNADCPVFGDDGEATFESEEHAWACGVDYIYNEDGDLEWAADSDDPESCVPNWRDWYRVEDGTLTPDMVYAIVDEQARNAFFDELPAIVAGMSDGDVLRITSTATMPVAGGGMAWTAPVTQYLQYQQYMSQADLATGASGALVGYTCSVSPVPLANSMQQPSEALDLYAVSADGADLDSAMRAALIEAVQ